MEATIHNTLNEQFKNEVYSAWLYLSMSAWLEAQHLSGFAHWMRKQSEEEWAHAIKVLEHLEARGQKPVFPAIEAPPQEWKGVLELFEAALAHEKRITASWQSAMEKAIDAKDYVAMALAQWFLQEQLEEERSVESWVERLKMIGESRGGLLHLDHIAGKRGGES